MFNDKYYTRGVIVYKTITKNVKQQKRVVQLKWHKRDKAVFTKALYTVIEWTIMQWTHQ